MSIVTHKALANPSVCALAKLQSAYANATGHAPVYPEWTTGFWQCKNRYHNQTQVLDVVEGYQSRGLPISLIIIDYFSWSPLPLGNEQLPVQCWPDPKVGFCQGRTRLISDVSCSAADTSCFKQYD